MYASLTAHLARHGFQAARRDTYNQYDNQFGEEAHRALQRLRSPGSMAVLLTTIAAFLAVSFAVEYIIRIVIGNMAIVENTSVQSEPSQSSEGFCLLRSVHNEEKMGHAVVRTTPITTKLRTALQHLRAVGGCKSYFRGIKAWGIYTVFALLSDALLSMAFGFIPFGHMIANAVTAVLTSALHCSWTQATLRAPSDWHRQQRQPVLHLVAVDGAFEPKTINVPFSPGSVRIGRYTDTSNSPTPLNGFFDSKVMSRSHAKIWADFNGSIWIQDTQSSNGTYINGERLSDEGETSGPSQLQRNDILDLGIDIKTQDGMSILISKIAARVEHAGPHGLVGNKLDLGLNKEHHKIGRKQHILGVWSRKLILPTLQLTAATMIVEFGTDTAAKFSRESWQTQTDGACAIRAIITLLPIATATFGCIFMIIPAMITLVRTEASLIPESDEVIVPLDRTFDGLVDLSRTHMQSGTLMRIFTLMTLGSWKLTSMDVASRVVLIYFKFFLLTVFVALVFFLLIYVELYAILGDKLMVLLAVVQDQVRQAY
jgi:pSer/pThr/pTyr-binding forkhead associated (FHA) protein